MKSETYASVEKQMELWRMGFITFPRCYIDYHRDIAKAMVAVLEARGYTIHRQWFDYDGFGDGMQTTFLIVETPSGHLKKLHWKDSHQKGSWFEHYSGHGGSFPHVLQGG